MSPVLKSIVALSLLLNLLLAGIIVGHFGRHVVGMRMHDQVELVTHALPADKREHFADVMQRAEKDSNDLYAQIERSRATAVKLLKAVPFDKTAFLAQMQDVEQIHAQLKRRLAMAVAQAADGLSPEERALMADMLQRPMQPPTGKKDEK